jgi:AcrR family transcriptional regulator
MNIGSVKYSDTEIKIKDAAKFLFLKKGFSATKTREIAKESNINLALLNYYFTSKRKLFEIIMLETVYDFFSKMVEVYNDEKTTLEEKLKLTSSKYIDMMIAEPHLPTFIVNELKNNPSSLLKILKGKMIMSLSLLINTMMGLKRNL